MLILLFALPNIVKRALLLIHFYYIWKITQIHFMKAKLKLFVLACVAGLLFGCTKAPEPVLLYKPLTSTTMPPMSGSGDYAAQILIWRNYTTSFYDFSILHNTLGSMLRQSVGIAFWAELVQTRFMNAYYALIALDDLFVEGIYQFTAGTDIPPGILDPIQPVDFSIKGGSLSVKYLDSWLKFRSQIYAIVKKANTESETGRELKAAAEDFITKVDSCISLMNTVL